MGKRRNREEEPERAKERFQIRPHFFLSTFQGLATKSGLLEILLGYIYLWVGMGGMPENPENRILPNCF
ncbi:hypothetical protein SBA4_4160006 [Candidatus Sulfopaludibacter sp. SbA4]|nr:hypothetical protein SBA4_4160006 [Candidatus Sulfopaludibacter sp. SbA4]